MVNTIPVVEAVGYMRFSTRLQDEEIQRNSINQLSQREGFKINSEYIDKAVSGRLSSRPELDKMLAEIRAGVVKTVVIYKMDRLGRSLANLIDLLQEFKNKRVRLISICDGVDTEKDDPMSRAFFQLLGVFAELECEMIRQRVLDGQANARAKGKHCGRPRGSKDKGGQRSKSGYYLRYAGKTKEQRKLGERKEENK
ncbi:MAG: recombinase family protein [Candidatus Omnitrophota bacterium]|nr:recombinase family protein [Candidatus Omnitrophota bacterium]